MDASESVGRGPVFIAGRQHSGNTVLAVMFSRMPGCLSQIDESVFFEQRGIFDGVKDPLERSERVYAAIKLEREELGEAVRAVMRAMVSDRPGASAVDLYRAGMDEATRLAGASFWAQKATSYIFYSREIFTAFPDARLIYMERNPYDIAASKKRRNARKGFMLGTALGWNKGMRIAARLEREHPGRFLVVRYEDLVQNPEAAVGRVCGFVGVEYDPVFLEVPHVNRSETSYYSLTGDGKGLSRSRVYYYRENLTEAEIASMDYYVMRGELRERVVADYPDLPHRIGSWPMGVKVRAWGMIVRDPLAFAWLYLTWGRRSVRYLITRTLHRINKA